jgi:hypothetical protein
MTPPTLTESPRWADQWPKEQRQLAWKLVAKAKEKGTLKSQPGEVCGNTKTIAHHEQYLNRFKPAIPPFTVGASFTKST